MFSSNSSQVSNDANYIEDVFSTYLYTGTGATLSIVNNIDLSTKGGLTWIKSRTTGTSNHVLYDTARGATQGLYSNTTGAQVARGAGLTAFNSNGFTLGSSAYENNSGDSMASWTFRKQPKFFDIVTYTGNNSSQTINHNLGSVPGCIIVKCSSGADSWFVYHSSLGTSKYLKLETTDAAATSSGFWGSVTSTSFGTTAALNASGQTYVAYLFASDSGGFGLTGTDNVISCGSYTGNGSATGPVVTLGYEPQYLIVKRTDNISGADWYIFDNIRGMSFSSANVLRANATSAESTTAAGAGIIPTATGFQPITTAAGINASGGTYVYIAIRRGPMKVPTDATKLFAAGYASSSGTYTTTAGFPIDMFMYGNKSASGSKTYPVDRLRGQKYLITNSTAAEISDTYGFDSMTTAYLSSASGNYSSYINWMFKRAPSVFDVVCYTGTGSAMTVSHNLKAAPEFMIVRRRDAIENWFTYSAALGPTKRGPALESGTDTGATGSGYWNDTAPTSSVFTVGVDTGTNYPAGTYVAYLFATCPGVSKVGSYTGTGTTKQVDCGFASGARFVLIRRLNSAGDWYVWDSTRGIVSGNDPYLLINSTAAEVTTTDYIDPYSAGFEISSTAPAAINASGGSFIFLAIA